LVLSKEKPIPYQPPLPPNEAPSGVDAAAGVTPVGLRPPFVTPAAAHSHPDCRGIPILIVAPHHGAIHSLGAASRELIATLSGEVSGRDGDALRVAERLTGEIEGFDRTLLRHLDDEEDLIIPLILERARDDPNFR